MSNIENDAHGIEASAKNSSKSNKFLHNEVNPLMQHIPTNSLIQKFPHSCQIALTDINLILAVMSKKAIVLTESLEFYFFHFSVVFSQ